MSTNNMILRGMTYNGHTVNKWYNNGDLVLTYHNITYYLDSNTSYSESIEKGASILEPTTFTPEKSGYTFLGWRRDTLANQEVEARLKASEDTTLYAVFSKDVALTYYDGSTTAHSHEGTVYYNNGNLSSLSFTLGQSAVDGWTTRGWSTSNAGNANIDYSDGASITLNDNLTVYGLYQKTITVTYYNNSGSASTATGTRYWNSGSNKYANPSFTLTQASKSGWSARGWSTTNKGNASITYNNNTAFTRDSDITLYGLYSNAVTLSYNANGGSGTTASQSGTAYWAPAGAISVTFTLRSNGFTYTNRTFQKWAQGSASGTQYAAGANITLTASTTFYAVWAKLTGAITANMVNTDIYDQGWDPIQFSSITPADNEFFTLSSDKMYLTVNKSCSVTIHCVADIGGGNGRLAFFDVNGYINHELGLDEGDGVTDSSTYSYSAGSRIYVRAYSHYAVPGAITFCIDNMTLTFTATAN